MHTYLHTDMYTHTLKSTTTTTYTTTTNLPRFVHVLPDANDMLTEAVGGGYPWAHVMALTGMLLIVGVNQVGRPRV